MRPRAPADLRGQQNLSRDSVLLRSIAAGRVPSLVLYGPPGTGKTSAALLLAEIAGRPLEVLSAVDSGIARLRKILGEAQPGTILFVDEIHRWSKTQQDALLHAVEREEVVLFAATTQPPRASLTPALLSRLRSIELFSLDKTALQEIAARALEHDLLREAEPEALDLLTKSSGGDARAMLAALETASLLCQGQIDVDAVRSALQGSAGAFAEADLVSAWIKSMRQGGASGALYWLSLLRREGADTRFLARRMMIFASEDVGLARSGALVVTEALARAVEGAGEPECWINLAHGTVYLALCPKSWDSYHAWLRAEELVASGQIFPPPAEISSRAEGYVHPAEGGRNPVLPEEIDAEKIFRRS